VNRGLDRGYVSLLEKAPQLVYSVPQSLLFQVKAARRIQ